MRKLLAAAVVAPFGIAATASAGEIFEEHIALGDLGPLLSTADGGSPLVIDFTTEDNPGEIVGWGISFVYDEVPASASWASDIRMVLSSPGGASVSVGGLSTASDFDWDFQGSGSTLPGPYDDLVPGDDDTNNLVWLADPQSKGDWTVSFHNDWNSTGASELFMNDTVLTLYKIPAPGALALLGVAGLCGSRRRRR